MVGWHFVPCYIRSCLKYFVPVSALDVAWMKASPGRGSMYLEATVDADHRIHAIGISDQIGTENLVGYEGFSRRNVEATGGDQSPLLAGRVALGDGNVAIPSALQRTRPATCFVRDWRHHQQEVPKRMRPLFQKFKFTPPGRKAEVDTALAKLATDDPGTHRMLTSIPLAQWCLSHIPTPTHSHTTSNMVEILACMLLGARRHTTLLGSLVHVMLWCQRRWLGLWDTAHRMTKEVRPPRQEAELRRVLQRARDMHCAVATSDVLQRPDQVLTVNCQREPAKLLQRVMLRVNAGIQQAWAFAVAGGSANVMRQSHFFNIGLLLKRDFMKACSCGMVAHTWINCPHGVFCLQHHSLMNTVMFNKPWLFQWQEQLGRTSDTTVLDFVIDLDMTSVVEKVVSMAREGRLMRVSHAALSVREKKRTSLKGDEHRTMGHAEAATSGAQQASRAAGQSVKANWPRQTEMSKGMSTGPVSSSSSVSTCKIPGRSAGNMQHGSSSMAENDSDGVASMGPGVQAVNQHVPIVDAVLVDTDHRSTLPVHTSEAPICTSAAPVYKYAAPQLPGVFSDGLVHSGWAAWSSSSVSTCKIPGRSAGNMQHGVLPPAPPLGVLPPAPPLGVLPPAPQLPRVHSVQHDGLVQSRILPQMPSGVLPPAPPVPGMFSTMPPPGLGKHTSMSGPPAPGITTPKWMTASPGESFDRMDCGDEQDLGSLGDASTMALAHDDVTSSQTRDETRRMLEAEQLETQRRVRDLQAQGELLRNMQQELLSRMERQQAQLKVLYSKDGDELDTGCYGETANGLTPTSSGDTMSREVPTASVRRVSAPLLSSPSFASTCTELASSTESSTESAPLEQPGSTCGGTSKTNVVSRDSQLEDMTVITQRVSDRDSEVLCSLRFWFAVSSSTKDASQDSVTTTATLPWGTPLMTALTELVKTASLLTEVDPRRRDTLSTMCIALNNMLKAACGDFIMCFSMHGSRLTSLNVGHDIAGAVSVVLHEDEQLESHAASTIEFEVTADSIANIARLCTERTGEGSALMGEGSALAMATDELLFETSAASDRSLAQPNRVGEAEGLPQSSPSSRTRGQRSTDASWRTTFGDVMGCEDVQDLVLLKAFGLKPLTNLGTSGLMVGLDLALAQTCRAGLDVVSKHVTRSNMSSAPITLLQADYEITNADDARIQAAVVLLQNDPELIWNAEQARDSVMCSSCAPHRALFTQTASLPQHLEETRYQLVSMLA